MKIIVTTSDKYHHILPIFFHLYNKFWGAPAELVGYTEPPSIPDNFTFHSLGKQRGRNFFSDDMHNYFHKQDDYFVWLMEDTFIKEPVNVDAIISAKTMIGASEKKIGRINLSSNWQPRYFVPINDVLCRQMQGTPYRVSTQPSLWNKSFLLYYMTPGLTPWDFESQETKDTYEIIAMNKEYTPIQHNEGVRRFDLHKYNLEGIDEQTINEMKQLNII